MGSALYRTRRLPTGRCHPRDSGEPPAGLNLAGGTPMLWLLHAKGPGQGRSIPGSRDKLRPPPLSFQCVPSAPSLIQPTILPAGRGVVQYPKQGYEGCMKGVWRVYLELRDNKLTAGTRNLGADMGDFSLGPPHLQVLNRRMGVGDLVNKSNIMCHISIEDRYYIQNCVST